MMKFIRRLMSKWYFNKDCSPKRCTQCGNKDFYEITRAIDGGVVSEMEVKCLGCDNDVGYFAYGYYSPDYVMSYVGAPQ